MYFRTIKVTKICLAMACYTEAAEGRSLTSEQVDDVIRAPGGGVMIMASARGGCKRGVTAARPIRACRLPIDSPCTTPSLCLPLQLGSVLPSFAAVTLTFVYLRGCFDGLLCKEGRMLWLTQVLKVIVMRADRLQVAHQSQKLSSEVSEQVSIAFVSCNHPDDYHLGFSWSPLQT